MTNFIPSDYITTQEAYNIIGKKLFKKDFEAESHNFQNMLQGKNQYSLSIQDLYSFIESPFKRSYNKKEFKQKKLEILEEYNKKLDLQKSKAENFDYSKPRTIPPIKYNEMSENEKNHYIECGMQYTVITQLMLEWIHCSTLRIFLLNNLYGQILELPQKYWLSNRSRFDVGISKASIPDTNLKSKVIDYGTLIIKRIELENILEFIDMSEKNDLQINKKVNERDEIFEYAKKVYISPYIYAQLKAARDMQITDNNQPVKEMIISQLRQEHPDESLYSNNLIGNMATLLRTPEAKKGGNINSTNNGTRGNKRK
ncbi:MAG: hypothetical protein J0H68_04545 [Sphingobacteriia bacterium]|nr:hypothetical protein [Sphingobacteriia bacterium]